jgi:hypothetical protein
VDFRLDEIRRLPTQERLEPLHEIAVCGTGRLVSAFHLRLVLPTTLFPEGKQTGPL